MPWRCCAGRLLSPASLHPPQGTCTSGTWRTPYSCGVSRARQVDGCGCGSRITIASGAGPRTRTHAWRISAWLGFEPDAGLSPLWRQSDRGARYDAALADLVAAGRLYACACSRRDVGGERYAGRCRDRGLPLDAGHGLRVRLDDGPETASDLVHGPLMQRPSAQCGDVLVRDRDGHWTYQFAVTVDDIDQGITLVIRGTDLIESTGRQVALMRLLGRAQPPVYLHHPLIHGDGGAKLSKSEFDTGVRELRAHGLAPEEVVGRAAAAVGLVTAGASLAAAAARRLFED